MNEVPTPPRSPRPGGVRITPGLLSGAMAVLVLMVFTVAFLLTRQEPPPAPPGEPVSARTKPPSAPPSTQPPSTRPSTSEPPPTGEAKFSGDVDPCELLGEELLTKLVIFPKQQKIYKEECEWTTLPSYGAGLPTNMTFRLKVYTKVFPDGVTQAHEQFVARRHEASLIPRGYTKAEPAVGDDSYVTAYTLEGSDRGPTKAIVGVRVSNAVVEVEYDRDVIQDPEGRLTAGALETARAVAEKLSSGGG
ncbi:hypothetical protein [Nonomuraea sp. B1E8]|uniref:hypothetical protein n=1 Tax=unclassified Nonomuraea TaxID=2593643 RepID=UPI00325C5B25